MSLKRQVFCAWCQAPTPHNVVYDNVYHTFELTCDGHGDHVVRISGNATKAEIDEILANHAEAFKGWVEPTPPTPINDKLADLFGEN